MSAGSSRISPATQAAAAAFALLPLWQFAPIDFDRTAVLTFLPALWLGRDVLAETWQRLPPLRGGGVWLAGATACALVLSPHPAPATTIAANWIVLGALGLLIHGLANRDPADGRRLLGAPVVGGVVGTVVAAGLWLLSGRGMMTLYAHPRIFGLHLIGGAVAATALLATGWTTPRTRWTWLATGGIVWGGLLWSGGRTPVMALLGALGLWIAVAPAPLRRRLGQAGALLFVLGLGLSTLLWTDNPQFGWWHAFQRSAIQPTPETGTFLSQFSSTRSDFWRAAFVHGLDHPWFGQGPDTYRYLTPKLDGQQPHNFLLQFFLDLGIVGSLPLLLGLGWLGRNAGRQALAARGTHAGAPWLAVTVASVAAGLLDGVFYHLLPLATLAAALGGAVAAESARADRPRRRGGALLSAMALGALALHALVFHVVTIAPPPAGPDTWRARLVQAWPSSTLGLPRWLERWRVSAPTTALTWAFWAQQNSPSPNYYHLVAAQLLLEKGDRSGAEREFRAALAKAHASLQPDLRALIRAQGFPDPSAP